MKLIVGLGNPGKEYDKTRHNVGFMFLDYITDSDKYVLNKKFNALEYEYIDDKNKILFVKPLSFMNLSGEVVSRYANYYKIASDDILIIQDDLDMGLGNYKLQYNHGDGGHNGIKNIILNLETKKFMRLKIGISKIGNINTKDYVLSKFKKEELETLKSIFANFNNFISDYLNLNSDLLMGKYNSKI